MELARIRSLGSFRDQYAISATNKLRALISNGKYASIFREESSKNVVYQTINEVNYVIFGAPGYLDSRRIRNRHS